MENQRSKRQATWNRLLLSETVRDAIISLVPPAFPNVFCRAITKHYGTEPPPEDTQSQVEIYGIYTADTYQSLLCSVDGNTTRDIGTPFYIAHSTAIHVMPRECGEIDLGKVVPVASKICFSGKFKTTRPTTLIPETYASVIARISSYAGANRPA